MSVFVLSGPARIGDGWSGTTRGLHVRLLHAAGRTLAVVGESEADVAATARAFQVTVAAVDESGRPPASLVSPVDPPVASC